MKLSQLVTLLQEKAKEADRDVEFIVVTPRGAIVTAQIQKTAKAMAKLLRLFL